MKKYTKKQLIEAIAYWKNKLEKLNENTIIPQSAMKKWPNGYLFNPNPKTIDAYDKQIDDFCEIVDKNIYNIFVPDEEYEFETSQRDILVINLQDTISEEKFYERLIFKLEEKYGEKQIIIPLKELSNSICYLAEKISQEALDNYDPYDHIGLYHNKMHFGEY